MFFWGCNKNEVFKDSKKLSRNIDKKLNVKDKDMCYFYRERERERVKFQFIWSHISLARNAENMERQKCGTSLE